MGGGGGSVAGDGADFVVVSMRGIGGEEGTDEAASLVACCVEDSDCFGHFLFLLFVYKNVRNKLEVVLYVL